MKRAARLVVLLALLLGLWNIWGYDLWAPDEPYFAEGAREMIHDGQWIVPHVNGVVTTDKPPLFFWLIALFSLPFGEVTSFSARLPSVLAGAATVALTIRLGRRLFGEQAGVAAGLVLATAYLPWSQTRSAQIDALLVFFIVVALSAFEAFRAGDVDGRRAGVLFWVAGGLATLAKGPVGFLIPLGIALLTLAFDRDLRAWRRFAPVLGPLALVGTCLLWAVPAELWGGDYSLIGALKEHFLNRGMRGLHHPNPPPYFLYMTPLQFLPWAFLLPGAFLLARRRWREEPAARLLVAWSIFVVLLFTLSNERRNLYVLPVYPGFALLVAWFWRESTGARDGSAAGSAAPVVATRWFTVAQAVLAGFYMVLALALPTVAARKLALVAGPPLWILAATLAVGAVLLVLDLRGGRRARSLFTAAATMAAVYLVAAALIFPPFNVEKSARPFSEAMQRHTAAARAEGGRVVAFDLSNLPEAFALYSRIYTVEVATWQLEKLVAHLDQPAEAWAVLDERELPRLPDALRARLRIVERADLSRKNVVLVVNR